MDAAAGRHDRTLIVMVSAIAVLVLIALAVIFSHREPQLLDPGTPAGVVQRYSSAVIEGDTETAHSLLTDEARRRCGSYSQPSQSTRVVLISTTEGADSTTVKVSIVRSLADSGPFEPSEYETDGTFFLVKSDGGWMVDRAPEPLVSCPGIPVQP